METTVYCTMHAAIAEFLSVKVTWRWENRRSSFHSRGRPHRIQDESRRGALTVNLRDAPAQGWIEVHFGTDRAGVAFSKVEMSDVSMA